jgi:hypothetical protein
MNKSLISILSTEQNFWTYFLIYLLYSVFLDISLWFVARVFAYEGYIYHIDPWKTLFSYGLAASIILLHLRYSSDRISGLFCLGIFGLFVLPAIIYFMRSEPAYWHGALVALGYVWLLFSCHFLSRVPLKIGFRGNRYIFWGSIGFLSIVTYALLFQHFRFQLNLNLSSIYEIRDQFTQNKNPFLGYLVIWQGNIINPLLFYLAIRRKNYLYVILIFFVQGYLFSVTGIKIFAFSLFFAYLIAQFARHLKVAVPIALMVGLVLSCLLYWYQGNVWPISLFVRRTLFTPGQLTFEYFDFFSQNPYIYLSDSVLKNFLSYPYLLPPPLLIGIRYYDGQSANVGIMGNSYMHFGVAGIFIFLGLLSLLLVLFDKFASGQSANRPALYALVATPIISLINSGLFTVLLTHGLLLSFLLAVLMPSRELAENHSGRPVRISGGGEI